MSLESLEESVRRLSLRVERECWEQRLGGQLRSARTLIIERAPSRLIALSGRQALQEHLVAVGEPAKARNH
jgi:hypothetical protein